MHCSPYTLCQHAFTQWKQRKDKEKLESVVDYAESKYGRGFVSDVKALKAVTYMFLPLPIFWALFDQQVKGMNLIVFSIIFIQ